MKVILIPGLGFDCRIFQNLNLTGVDVEKLDWIEPEINEEIHDYALRLFSIVSDGNQPYIIIGHSLGGVIAQEIASVHKVDLIVLISSIKSRCELPNLLKMVRPLNIHKLFTKALTQKSFKYWGKNHGFETEEEKNLFLSMLNNQTNNYLQWALQALSSWHEPDIDPETKIVHIHGDNDKTLPYKNIKGPNFTIKNGSHFCVYKKAEQINKILADIL